MSQNKTKENQAGLKIHRCMCTLLFHVLKISLALSNDEGWGFRKQVWLETGWGWGLLPLTVDDPFPRPPQGKFEHEIFKRITSPASQRNNAMKTFFSYYYYYYNIPWQYTSLIITLAIILCINYNAYQECEQD